MPKGFTLIELLIVIAILGILATTSISSYSKTRESAELSIQTDTIVSKLREAKTLSQNATTPECIGYYFSNNQSSIQEIKIPFNNQFDPCSASDNTTIQSTNLNDNELQVTKISTTGSGIAETNEIDDFTILYYPPKGEFKMYSSSPDNLSTEILAQKVQIQTVFKQKENTNYITILNSGIIQKELITDNETK